ncbi:conserved oligomeric Golgi complex subunit 8 isoform X2 [Phymastichus coffea]|uniref:conserved oligomeric Golgi complex subunit 8 isoform X2 n=1 Tax=Phymastichus coffea TaxID=108790 RepID=UPI00273BFBC8|nr:conserved oligomeric Golgi complex subunit 8 isoform X2 [Phymastichus coffea]
MDIETVKMIELLFPNNFPDSWKDNSDFYQYLSKIGEYDVDQINSEPDHLINEKNAVQQRIHELVFSNYRTFIHTAECCRKIFQEFNQTEKELDCLVEKVPQFMNKCTSFCNKSNTINTHKRLNTLALNKNTELLEILELPYLMELCLKTDQYSEALELSQYARNLGVKHRNIPIICNIINEVENKWSLVVNQVFNSLKEDLPLPRCLQLIGLLRSMDVFTESELRLKFIQARDTWFQSLLESIPTNNASIHLIKTIELSRINLYNIITQYKAIFNDDDHMILGSYSTVNDSTIFHEWLEEKVSKFLSTLEQDLPEIIFIDSILGQCTYFGLSFGKVGADFTGRMSEIFTKAISNKFDKSILTATRKFEKDIDQFTFVHKSIKSNIKIDLVLNSESPPEQLTDYYPLAEYCNGLIKIFNEIRLNTPVVLAQSFTKFLQISLQTIARTIFLHFVNDNKTFTALDRENIIKFTECFHEYLVPYIQYCIQALFPPNQVATYLGTSEIIYLNHKSILEPLESFLPIKNIP